LMHAGGWPGPLPRGDLSLARFNAE
jgi:hypothetical protein